MLRGIWKYPERRRHPRLEAALDLRVEVELYGFAGEAQPFFASGSTVNIGLGGLLALLDAPIPPGAVCKLFFRDAGEHVRPTHVAGRVLRVSERGDGFLIAVQFDEPLLRLSPRVPAAAVVER